MKVCLLQNIRIPFNISLPAFGRIDEKVNCGTKLSKRFGGLVVITTTAV